MFIGVRALRLHSDLSSANSFKMPRKRLVSGVTTHPKRCGFVRPRLAVRGFPMFGEKGILVVEPIPGIFGPFGAPRVNTPLRPPLFLDRSSGKARPGGPSLVAFSSTIQFVSFTFLLFCLPSSSLLLGGKGQPWVVIENLFYNCLRVFASPTVHRWRHSFSKMAFILRVGDAFWYISC